ncbi:MAG: methyltransferase domain-containing protein [Anaerolineae bacterium]|nr:MAG: methyltransferase domain-containing protein [Anaerolineae bacterium]
MNTHFDWLAPVYDRLIRRFSSLETMLELADLPVAGRLLDVGGGTGRVAEALRPYVEQVVVADASSGMLRQAVSKDGLQAVCAGAEALPFPDESFDRVVIVDALHHVADQAATAGEMWRVLRSGGRIVIQEPDVRTALVKMIALFEKVTLMRSRFLSLEQMAALFPQANAEVTTREEAFNAWVVVYKVPV